MNRTVVCIVEGDGEVRAIPILIRRLAAARGIYDLTIPPPIRVHRDQFLNRTDEFERKVLLASAKAQGGVVLILLDADDDCPVLLAREIDGRARPHIRDATLCVVIPNREYEAWFLAAAESIAGLRGLNDGLASPPQPDSLRNAKGWLSERMNGGRYHEVSDQPALSALFDIDAAHQRSRSFRKLVETVDSVVQAYGSG